MDELIRVGAMLLRTGRVDALVPVVSLPTNGYAFGVLHLSGGGTVYLMKDDYAALLAILMPSTEDSDG